MVEVDPLTGIFIPILGVIVAVAIPLLLWSMGAFRKTSQDTITGTIEIRGLKTNLEQSQETTDKRFDKLDGNVQRLWEAVNQNQSKLSLQEYRIKQLEHMNARRSAREREDENGNG